MRPVDRVLLGLLILDGFVVGLLSVGFCYVRFWGQPVPFVAILAGLANAVLLWLAARHTDGPARYGPLAAWLTVLVIALVGGPGGDVPLYLGGTTIAATAMLFVFGLGIPAALAAIGRLPDPDPR